VGLATAAVALASWVGVVTIHYGQLTALWPANGVLLAFVLTAPQRRWPAYLAGGCFANLAVGLFTHDHGSLAITVALANALEVYVAAWAFRKSAPCPPDLGRTATMLRFAAFAVMLAPMLASAWMVVATPHFMAGYPLAVKFRNWYLGDALGILLCVPLTLALLEPSRAFTARQALETAGLLGIATLASLFVFRNEIFPFPFVVLVVLIPVTFRLGLASSAFGVLLISFPASYYTFLGRGPLSRVAPLHWGLYLQLYFLILLATVYVLSAVREEEKRLADDLRNSEMRYRALAETSQDLILRTTLDGARTYVSPSVRAVTGWTEEELPPPGNYAILIHPSDRAHFYGFLEKYRSQPGSHTLVYRARRRDGHYAWLEACVGAVFSEGAVPHELVWTIRDISLRIEHEERLQSERQKAQELAWTDGLTGLSNRRAFDDRLAAEWIFAGQHSAPLSLLLLDVDHFKQYNDTYGHQMGDEVLRQVARVIGECTRQSGDLAARYGGEEFVVVLPHADAARAQEVAERIRESVQQLRLEHSQSSSGFLTLSIGVSSASRVEGMTSKALVESADGALYAAKRGGRNRISIAPDPVTGCCQSEPARAPDSIAADAPRPA